MMMDPLQFNESIQYNVSGDALPNGNRSRLDSGTSGSSDSSRSGKPPRRRSHRPRGCRGGSNRRRNPANQDIPRKHGAQGKGPQGEMRPKGVPSHHKRAPAPWRQNKQGVAYGVNRTSVPPMQELTILSRNEQPGNTMHAYSQNPNMNWNSSVSSTSTAPLTDNSFSHGDSHGSLSMPNDFSNNAYEHDAIQQSFSDSSSSFSGPESSILPPENPAYLATGTESRQILPPLPPRSFTTSESSIPTGPNPYALKLVAHENSNPSDYRSRSIKEQDIYANTNNFMGGYSTPFKSSSAATLDDTYSCLSSSLMNNKHGHQSNSTLYNSSMPPPPRVDRSLPYNHKPLQISTEPSGENDYRSERLQIQRQNVEGGSLFATSPRSFLLGRRNNCFPAAQTVSFRE